MRAIKKYLIFGVIAILVLLMVVTLGCKKTTEKTTGKKLVFAFSNVQSNNPATLLRIKGMKEYLDKQGVELLVAGGELDINKQIADVENFIAKKVDAIILQPLDSKAIVPAIEEANKAGIPVIMEDINAEGGKTEGFVHGDCYMAGYLVGEELGKRMNGEGEVAIINYPMVSSVRAFEAGEVAALSVYPDIKIVARQVGGAPEANIATVENWIKTYPNLKGIIAPNDAMAFDALTAVKAAGKEEQIMICGIGGIPEAVEEIKKGGAFIASSYWDLELEGRMAAELALKVVKGEEILLREIVIPVALIKQEK